MLDAIILWMSQNSANPEQTQKKSRWASYARDAC